MNPLRNAAAKTLLLTACLLPLSSCLSLSNRDPDAMAADDLTWPLLGDVAIGAAFGFFSGPLGLVMVFAVPITDLRLATGRWAWE